MIKMRINKLRLVFGSLLLCGAVNVSAQYPEKAIRLVVPFAPGGTSEIVARSVASSLTQQLGQSVYVENKPGAAGNIAMAEVKRAPPDGYTLILGHVGTLAVNPVLFGSKLPYDPNSDFVAISLIAKVPNVIAVSLRSGFKTLADLVSAAKANPGLINYGSAGNGSAGHLAMAYFAAEAGIELTHVPYKGSGPMLTDLIGGQTQATFNGLPSLVSQIKGGALVPLAVGSAARALSLPEVPTIAESGYPNFETSQWYGLLAPAGTSMRIVNQLQKELVTALKSPEGTKRMREDGALLIGDTPQEFTAFIAQERSRWEDVIKKAKIRID